MKTMDNIGLVELSKEEMGQISGGFVAVLGLLVAVCAFAYNYGKDAAERDRRLQETK